MTRGIADAAFDVGFTILGYVPQAAFLLGNNILTLSALTDSKTRLIAKQQLKKLLLPTEMGAAFHCIALAKEITPHLNGFQLEQLGKL